MSRTRAFARRPVATLGVALVLGCSANAPSEPAGPASEPWRDELAAWTHPAPLPSFPLVDQQGRAFSLRELAGQKLLVGFVFTRCTVATACPLTLTRLREVRRLADRQARSALDILVVTLDPEHDTPAVLAEHARRHGLDVAGVRFATGSRAVIDGLSSLFNVVALRRDGPDGGVDLAHPVKVALLDEKLVPVREWRDNDFDPGEIVHASIGQ